MIKKGIKLPAMLHVVKVWIKENQQIRQRVKK